jgi:hypothetical protein
MLSIPCLVIFLAALARVGLILMVVMLVVPRGVIGADSDTGLRTDQRFFQVSC